MFNFVEFNCRLQARNPINTNLNVLPLFHVEMIQSFCGVDVKPTVLRLGPLLHQFFTFDRCVFIIVKTHVLDVNKPYHCETVSALELVVSFAVVKL